MRAIRITGYGGNEVVSLDEVARPAFGDQQLLVRVHASSVNPIDWKVREGYIRAMLDPPKPAQILGGDFSGVVEAVGSAVSGFKPGDEVYGAAGRGLWADYIAVDANIIALKPKSLDHVHAAGVPVAATTAWQALFEGGGLKSGQRVLIHAAAGGVGGFGVQFAHQAGAHVVGTASAANTDYVRGLGADEVIDYRAVDFSTLLRDLDLVVDFAGGESLDRSYKVLKSGGALVSIVAEPSAEEAAKANITAKRFRMHPDAKLLADVAAQFDEDKLKVEIAEVFSLNEVARALDLSKAARTRGKLVLKLV